MSKERISYVQLWPHHVPLPENARISAEDTGPHARHAVLIEYVDEPRWRSIGEVAAKVVAEIKENSAA